MGSGSYGICGSQELTPVAEYQSVCVQLLRMKSSIAVLVLLCLVSEEVKTLKLPNVDIETRVSQERDSNSHSILNSSIKTSSVNISSPFLGIIWVAITCVLVLILVLYRRTSKAIYNLTSQIALLKRQVRKDATG